MRHSVNTALNLGIEMFFKSATRRHHILYNLEYRVILLIFAITDSIVLELPSEDAEKNLRVLKLRKESESEEIIPSCGKATGMQDNM
jgi:hypothetical protein